MSGRLFREVAQSIGRSSQVHFCKVTKIMKKYPCIYPKRRLCNALFPLVELTRKLCDAQLPCVELKRSYRIYSSLVKSLQEDSAVHRFLVKRPTIGLCKEYL
ncbi:hypothetical protein pb186bvf_019217 [Paramecium bursaria]